MVAMFHHPQPYECMTPGCTKKQQWKGICRSCYGQALRLIEANKTTWDELADMGMVTLEEKPFTELFRKKKLEKESKNERP